MNLNYHKLYGLLIENEPSFLDLVPYFRRKRLEKKEKSKRKFQEIAKNEVTEEEILSFGEKFYFKFEVARKTYWEEVSEEEFNKKFIEEKNGFSFYNFAPLSIILPKALKRQLHKNIKDAIGNAILIPVIIIFTINFIMAEKSTLKEKISTDYFTIDIIITIFLIIIAIFLAKKYICKEKKYFKEQDKLEKIFFEEKMKERKISLSCDEFEKKFKKLKEFYDFSESKKCFEKLVDETFGAIYLNAPKDETVKEAIKYISE